MANTSLSTLSLFTIGLLTAGVAAADVYVVRPDGSGDFPTIQAAVVAAIDGDVVELVDGTFRGSGNRDVDYLGKAITIRSQSGSAQACIVDCEGSSGNPHRGFRFVLGEAGGATLEDITIRNGYGLSIEHGFSAGGAIYCTDSSPTIRGCRLSANTARMGGGIACVGSSALIEGCTLTDNGAEFGGAIAFLSTGSLVVSGCTLYANHAPSGGGGGIYFVGDLPPPTLTIENTIIVFGTEGEGLRCDEVGTVTLSCSDVYGNAGGDWIGCIADQAGVRGNLAADPLFCGAEFDDFHLDAASPCAPEYNPECGLIGAWPVNCGNPTPVLETSWGRIKGFFGTNDRPVRGKP